MKWDSQDEDRFKRYVADPKGYEGTLVPIDQGWSLEALVRMALRNIDSADIRPAKGFALVGRPVKVGEHVYEVGGQQRTLDIYKELDPRMVEGVRRPTPREEFQRWLGKQPIELQRFALHKVPLYAIYRIGDGLHSLTTGRVPLAVPVSYKLSKNVPLVGLQVLGVVEGLGSTKQPLWTDAGGVHNVTERLRGGAAEFFKEGKG